MMLGEHSLPSNCTGYHNRPLRRWNTGNIALRLAEGQPPKTRATLSLCNSLVAFCAKIARAEAPSPTMGPILCPSQAPPALISTSAIISAALTVTSLIAMVPVRDCSTPTLTESAALAPVAPASMPTTEATANRNRGLDELMDTPVKWSPGNQRRGAVRGRECA